MSCLLLYVVGQLRAGGLERQLCFLLGGLDRKRYRPELVVWNYVEDDIFVSQVRKLGVPIHAFPQTFSGVDKIRRFRSLVLKIKPEVIHSYSFYTNFAAWLASVGNKAIAIGAIQSDFLFDKKEAGIFLGQLSAHLPPFLISNNKKAVENLGCRKNIFPSRKVFVVRNGLDLNFFKNVPIQVAEPGCIVGIGSLRPVKRWDRVLSAAAELKRMGFAFKVRIIGDGPLREAMKQKAKTLEVSKYVEFPGSSSDIRSVLAKAIFIVHTSDVEGCPNVIMEAMASGRAVVAMDTGDVAYLVDDERTGFVVPRGDQARLVKCMETLIADRELCRRMGEAGRVKAEHEFGLNRLVAETLVAYRATGWKDT